MNKRLKYSSNARSRVGGFTLVEVLVSLAVMGIMVLLLNQMIGSSVNTILRAKNNLNADDQARTLFDCMQRDVNGMARRSDVDVILYKSNGSSSINDVLFAFSRSSVYFDESSFAADEKNSNSLIGYRVNSQTSNNNGQMYYSLSSFGQLERLGKSLALESSVNGNVMPYVGYPSLTVSNLPIQWTAISTTTIAGFGFKSSDNNNTVGTVGQQFSDGVDPNYQVVGSRVFRMEFSYLLQDGTQSNIPITNPNYGGTSVIDNLSAVSAPMSNNDLSQGYGTGSRWYDTNAQIGYICTSGIVGQATWTQLGVQDVQAIVVTLALLPTAPGANPSNPQTAVIAQAPTLDLNTLASQFGKAVSNPHGSNTDVAGKIMSGWLTTINNAASGTSPINGLPGSVAAGIHVYQRYLFLQN